MIKETKNTREVASEIIQMVKQDQDMRNRSQDKSENWDSSIDQTNTDKLKEIITIIGWPSISRVGIEASNGAWLLAQHADHDLDFQKKCLQLMEELPKEDCNQSNIAYLTDRIQINIGEAQTYGTQFYQNESGQLIPRPIHDIENLEKRRSEMNMGTFKDYYEMMQNLFGKKN